MPPTLIGQVHRPNPTTPSSTGEFITPSKAWKIVSRSKSRLGKGFSQDGDSSSPVISTAQHAGASVLQELVKLTKT
jgi:hypothetical protein